MRLHSVVSTSALAAAIVGVLGIGGCVLRPTGTIQQVETRTISYSQPVAYSQPVSVVYRTAPVVYQPPPVVYRAAPTVYVRPSNVMTPVRISVPSGLYANAVCAPGTSRYCDAYCGGGLQFCSSDGRSWGSCIESW
jgi:hypothetical protein